MVYARIKQYGALWVQSLATFRGQAGKLTAFGFWRTLCAGFLTFVRFCSWFVALAFVAHCLFLFIAHHTTTTYLRMTVQVLGTALLLYLYTFFIVPFIVASVRCSMQRKDVHYFRHYIYLGLLAAVCAVGYAVIPKKLFLLFSPATVLIALVAPGTYFIDFIMPAGIFFTWYICSMFFYADTRPKNLFIAMYHGFTMMLANHPLFFIIQWPFLLLLYAMSQYLQVYEAGSAYVVLPLYYGAMTLLLLIYSCLIQVLYIQLRHTQKELYDAQ
jgi:hypothetical protein